MIGLMRYAPKMAPKGMHPLRNPWASPVLSSTLKAWMMVLMGMQAR